MNSVEIDLTQEMIEQATTDGRLISIKNSFTGEFGNDSSHLCRRFTIGFLGEMAVVEWLTGNWKNGIYSTKGDRKSNNHPDLDCIGCPRVGVKSISHKDGLPLISEYNTDFQVIVRIDLELKKAYILGVINPEDIMCELIEESRLNGNKHKLKFNYQSKLFMPRDKSELNKIVSNYYEIKKI